MKRRFRNLWVILLLLGVMPLIGCVDAQGEPLGYPVEVDLTGVPEPGFVLVAGNFSFYSDVEVDNVPVDGANTTAISSNWAYDHNITSTGVHSAGAEGLIHSGHRIDDLALPDANFDMNSNQIENVTDPNDNQDVATKKYVDDNAGGEVGEGHISIIPHNYNSIGQGTWAYQPETSGQFGGCLWKNSSRANGDNIAYKVYLAEGTYTLRVLYQKTTDGGICDIDIDGVEKGSFDNYYAGSQLNQVYTVTGIVIATRGIYDLLLRMDGKHAGSSYYGLYLSCVTLWRTE